MKKKKEKSDNLISPGLLEFWGDYKEDGTLKGFYSGKIVDSGYKLPIFNQTINPTPFSITFSWNGTEKTVSLVNGEDLFVLAGMFEKLLKDYGIKYKSEINIK